MSEAPASPLFTPEQTTAIQKLIDDSLRAAGVGPASAVEVEADGAVEQVVYRPAEELVREIVAELVPSIIRAAQVALSNSDGNQAAP